MRLTVVMLLICSLVPLTDPMHDTDHEIDRTHREWPTRWQAFELRPVALSAVEQRFAEGFPGRIGRFRAGPYTMVMRQVDAPTRKLHPAVDCYRGLGYRILHERLEQDPSDASRLWRCFQASNNDQSLKVCERTEDAEGRGFTDTSAWYWAALLGKTQGPWIAITRAEAIAPAR